MAVPNPTPAIPQILFALAMMPSGRVPSSAGSLIWDVVNLVNKGYEDLRKCAGQFNRDNSGARSAKSFDASWKMLLHAIENKGKVL
jgi:hypothetical protein